MFIKTLFIITQKTRIQLSLNWQIDKLWYIHKMEDWSPINANNMDEH